MSSDALKELMSLHDLAKQTIEQQENLIARLVNENFEQENLLSVISEECECFKIDNPI